MPVVPPQSTYRRRRLAGLCIVLGFLLLVVNAGQWLQHARLRERLDREIADRLLGIARVASLGVDGEMLERWSLYGVDLDERDRLEQGLRGVSGANAVSNVYIVDLAGRSILDLSGLIIDGAPNPLIALDRPAYMLATAGVPAASQLRAIDGQYLKAAYVPIESDDGDVVAVLAVEGAADLFTVIDDLRGTMAAIAIGSVLGIVLLGVVLVRISDSLARAEQELARAETLTAMGRMTAGIAHEIRNPLGIIRATAERWRRRHAAPATAAASADSIIEEVDRLGGILDGYLNFATERPSALVPVDLAAVARRSMRLIEHELDGIDRELDIEVEPAMIRGDAARLHQLLLNIILNARQAMPDGGTLRVGLAGMPDPPRYRLGIADTGVGIERQRLREIWKPFVTSKAEGSGLGLPIVRRIVEDHGGRVTIDSEPGRGTTITIEFPALSGAAAGHGGRPAGAAGQLADPAERS